MSEFFIISAHIHQQHETIEDARAEKTVLAAHFPDKEFTVYRCKRSMTGARHFPKMMELLNDIVRDGLTPTNRDRARIILVTIGNRTPSLTVAQSAPPEYCPPNRGGA